MITPPTAPSPGKPVSAWFFSRLIAWVKSGQLIDGVGYKLHRTPNGTKLIIKAASSKSQGSTPWLHPWKVFGLTKSDDVDHCFEIYIPAGTTVRMGGRDVEVDGLDPIEEKPSYFSFDESEIAERPDDQETGEYSILSLFVYSTVDEESEEDDLVLKALVTTDTLVEFEAREDVVDIIYHESIAGVCKVTGQDSQESGEVLWQSMTSQPSFFSPFYS